MKTCNGNFPREARDAARLYLDRGLAVVPLPVRSKDPGFPGWHRLRISGEDLVEHFPSGELRNVALLNGTPSGRLLDVDLDADEARTVARHLLPSTGWIFGRKSSPGSHWIYRADEALDAAQLKFADLDGEVLVELRGTGGITVYPPSVHPTGEAIRWEKFDEPGEVTLADLRQAVGEVAAAALLARHWPSKGTRDETALALAGGLARAGWPAERIETFLWATAEAAGDEEARARAQKAGRTSQKVAEGAKATGWTRLGQLLQGGRGTELVTRVRSWLGLTSRAEKKPRARIVPPWRPFPVEVLPSPVRDFVEQGGKALGCDASYLALPALGVVAAAIGNSRVLQLKRTWREPSIVWSVVVGESGTLKSPAFSLVLEPVYDMEDRLRRKHEQDLIQYKKDLARWEEEGRDEDAKPQEPPEPRLMAGDVTIERLCELLGENPRGLLAARDEVAGWLTSFARYRASSDLPSWLEAFRAGPMQVDRKTSTRKRLFIRRAAVSVVGGIQPGVLRRVLTDEHFDSGLAARMLLVLPPREPKTWNENEVADEVLQNFRDLLEKLYSLKGDPFEDGEAPHRLLLSPEAKAAWIPFYNSWAVVQANAMGNLAASFSKLEGYAARLGLLHHVVERIHSGEDDRCAVGLESIQAGITLARWFGQETERVYGVLEESDQERDTRHLVELLRKRGGRITTRELMRASRTTHPDAETALSALRQLVEAGLARWLEVENPRAGGSPTRAVELVGQCDSGDSDLDEEDPHSGDSGGDSDFPPDPTAPHEGAERCTGEQEREDPSTTVTTVTLSPGGEDEIHGGGNPSTTVTGQGPLSPTLSPGRDQKNPLHGKAVGGPSTVYPHHLVTRPTDLVMVLQALDETDLIGIDLETTGLDPRRDRIRLLSLALDTVDNTQVAYLLDLDKLGTDAVGELLQRLGEKNLILHNAAFDLAFLAQLGFVPRGKVRDTLLLSQLLTAGTFQKNDLASCVERHLGHRPDKALQKADWTGPLTSAQLTYAAADVLLLKPLLDALVPKIQEARLEAAARIEGRALPAITWMGSKGVPLDRTSWLALADTARQKAAQLRQDLDQAAPQKPGELFDSWNWDSPQQVKQALELAGLLVETTGDEALAALDHPLADLLRKYRAAQKEVSSYGAAWLEHVRADGRVYPSWKQSGAASGRMSCSEPNMQQLPRGGHRKCVVAPPGRTLVKADYSQIELRIAAKVSGDEALLDAYQRGQDLHTLTAQKVLGTHEVTKADRQLAKALNFGLLYGMGARGLASYARTGYGVDLTEDEARKHRDAFFLAYPGLAAWHRKVRTKRAKLTRTLSGRRRLLDEKTPDTQRLNSPIQGTGADGLKQALALLWERRDELSGAFPILAVHDEIVLEVDEEQAQAAAEWLKRAMLDGMAPLIDPVPVEVEVKIARTWGGD
ncbi:MAG: DNA polymerase [Gemmataceae bacterium]